MCPSQYPPLLPQYLLSAPRCLSVPHHCPISALPLPPSYPPSAPHVPPKWQTLHPLQHRAPSFPHPHNTPPSPPPVPQCPLLPSLQDPSPPPPPPLPSSIPPRPHSPLPGGWGGVEEFPGGVFKGGQQHPAAPPAMLCALLLLGALCPALPAGECPPLPISAGIHPNPQLSCPPPLMSPPSLPPWGRVGGSPVLGDPLKALYAPTPQKSPNSSASSTGPHWTYEGEWGPYSSTGVSPPPQAPQWNQGSPPPQFPIALTLGTLFSP